MRITTVQQISYPSTVAAMIGLCNYIRHWWPNRNSKTQFSDAPNDTYGAFARDRIKASIKALRELRTNYILLYEENLQVSPCPPDFSTVEECLARAGTNAAATAA